MSRITVEEVRFGDLALSASFGADQGIALGPSLLLPVDGLADRIAQAVVHVMDGDLSDARRVADAVVAALKGEQA
jgi:hypothetical protein